MKTLRALGLVCVLVGTLAACGSDAPKPSSNSASDQTVLPAPAPTPTETPTLTPSVAPTPADPAPAAGPVGPAEPKAPSPKADSAAPAATSVEDTPRVPEPVAAVSVPVAPTPVAPAAAIVEDKPVETKQVVEAKPVVDATPKPAPDLKLEPSSALAAGPLTVKVGALPSGTVVRYSLDSSDPSTGKNFPAAGLLVSQSSRLRVWAAQPGGEAATAEASLTVGEVWAQAGASGDGSWDKPLGTIEEALAKAGSLGVKRLKLMSGQWSLKADLSGTWDLSGGWKTLGEPGAPSILVGAKQAGSTQKEPAYTLRVTPSAKVSLSGLDVRSPNSSFGTAVLVEKDGILEVSGCRLSGGNGLYGYGLRAIGAASVSVTDSTCYGGDGGSSFALSAEKSTVKALRSTFDAGTGNAVSYGINVTLTNLSVVSSVLWGGAANSSYGLGIYSSERTLIQASTIHGGRGASSWGLYLSESEPEIVSCLIGAAGKTKSYGIFSNYGKSLPRVLRSNAFFGSATGAFAGADLGAISAQPGEGGAFTDASGKGLAGQSANLRVEASLSSAPELRLLAKSAPSVLKGAEALPGEAAQDRAGKPRGSSPAFGAWATSP